MIARLCYFTPDGLEDVRIWGQIIEPDYSKTETVSSLISNTL